MNQQNSEFVNTGFSKKYQSDPFMEKQYPMHTITCDMIVKCYYKHLILRRKDGLWCLPGGHLDPDELLIDCAARELEEETGIRSNYTVKYCGYKDRVDRDPRGRKITHVFSTEVDSEQITLSEEHTDYKWIYPHDIDSYEFLADHKDILKEYGQNSKVGCDFCH